MPENDRDPIADTAMFRAFVEKGESERAEKRSLAVPLLIAGVILLIATLAMIVSLL